jgi:hypothetical protein
MGRTSVQSEWTESSLSGWTPEKRTLILLETQAHLCRRFTELTQMVPYLLFEEEVELEALAHWFEWGVMELYVLENIVRRRFREMGEPTEFEVTSLVKSVWGTLECLEVGTIPSIFETDYEWRGVDRRTRAWWKQTLNRFNTLFDHYLLSDSRSALEQVATEAPAFSAELHSLLLSSDPYVVGASFYQEWEVRHQKGEKGASEVYYLRESMTLNCRRAVQAAKRVSQSNVNATRQVYCSLDFAFRLLKGFVWAALQGEESNTAIVFVDTTVVAVIGSSLLEAFQLLNAGIGPARAFEPEPRPGPVAQAVKKASLEDMIRQMSAVAQTHHGPQ